MSAERERVLSGVLDRLSGGRGEDGVPPSPSTPASPAELAWDGGRYVRTTSTAVALGPEMEPVDSPEIGVGWHLYTPALLSALVYDVMGGADPDTGEVTPVRFVCAVRERWGDLSSRVLSVDDVQQADQPKRATLTDWLGAVHDALGKAMRTRGRQATDHARWLRCLDDVWSEVMADKGWR